MITKQDITNFTREELRKTFGEDYLNEATQLSNEMKMDLDTLCYILRLVYEGTYSPRDFNLSYELETKLKKLYVLYSAKIREIYEILNQITAGHAGTLVNGKIMYDDEKYPYILDNYELRSIDDIMLMNDFFNIGVEYRVAHNIGDALMTQHILPRFSRFFDDRESFLCDKLQFKLHQYYEQLLIEAGYELEKKAKEQGRMSYYTYFGCEKYDFPQRYQARGSKLVLSRENALKLLHQWKDEMCEEPYLRINFNKSESSCTIVMNSVRLTECKKAGFAFSYPGVKNVLLKADYFQTHSGIEIEEDGKKLFSFYIP